MRSLVAFEEILIPPRGDCWNPRRLMDHNCEGCRYMDACTHPKKGHWLDQKNHKRSRGTGTPAVQMELFSISDRIGGKS